MAQIGKQTQNGIIGKNGFNFKNAKWHNLTNFPDFE
jgi:hypothetical protein